jgi:predicted ATPase
MFSMDEVEIIRRLCAALDGLPLAIELAAARTRLLSLHQLEQRLDDRFAVLSGGSRSAPVRQQTLQATMDWSYDLLEEAEQRLFCALSLFAGSFALDSAEAVVAAVAPNEDTLGLLGSLVDKSLVTRTEERFHMLPTLRQFASAKAVHSDLTAAKQNVVAALIATAEQVESQLATPEWAGWAERLRIEHGNLRSALAWSIDAGDTDAALRMAGALALHWTRCGLWSEGSFWLRRAASSGSDAPATVQLRDGLMVLRGIDDPAGALEALADVAGIGGEHIRAVRLRGAAAVVREGHDGETEVPADFDELRRQLGEAVVDNAWREGRIMAGAEPNTAE